MTIDIRIPPRVHGRLLVEQIAEDHYHFGRVRHPRGPRPKAYDDLSESGKKKRLRKLKLQAEIKAKWGDDTSSHSS